MLGPQPQPFAGEETFVVFAGKVFRYGLGDAAGRGEAVAYAVSIGVPVEQTDWAA